MQKSEHLLVIMRVLIFCIDIAACTLIQMSS